MRRIFVFIILMAMICVMPVSHSYSQDSVPSIGTPATDAAPVVETPEVPATDISAAAAVKKAAHVPFDERKYVDPTYSNLAHLYWSLGILDVGRDSLIDSFIAITECQMYRTYINNDLEWREIRETTRKYLRENYKKFPTNFKIMIPLYLDRYNYEEEYFDVNQEGSSIASARNIETIYYTELVTCGFSDEIEGYPRNLILNLNRPFSLPRLPVERELARLFLDEINNRRGNKVYDLNRVVRASDNPRFAYLELMFRVHSYRDTINTAGGTLKAIVYAQIDHIRVYADFDREKLLYEKDMYDDDRSAQRRRLGGVTADDLKLPEGPIFGEPETKSKK